MILNLFYITLILVFIIDYSGFITNIEEGLSKMISTARQRNIHIHIPRPFSCSLCCNFWAGLIYIIVTNQFSFLNLCIVCGFAASTIVLSEAMSFIRDLLLTIIEFLRKIFRV